MSVEKKSTLKTLWILLKLIIVSEYIQKLEQKSEFFGVILCTCIQNLSLFKILRIVDLNKKFCFSLEIIVLKDRKGGGGCSQVFEFYPLCHGELCGLQALFCLFTIFIFACISDTSTVLRYGECML